MQSDFSGVSVERPTELESTARGAAMLAGVGVGLFPSAAEAKKVVRVDRVFRPQVSPAAREAVRKRWEEAITRARSEKTG
jgi:glycerol kinase